MENRPAWVRTSALSKLTESQCGGVSLASCCHFRPKSSLSHPHRPEWLPQTFSWVQDAAQGEGPIGGLAAVLSQATYQNVLVLAVDMPAMTSDFFKKMLCMMERRSGIVPQIGERFEPLCAIYPCNALSVVRDQLFVKRDNSLQALLHCLIRSGLMHSFSVHPSELCLFRNLNLPSDCMS